MATAEKTPATRRAGRGARVMSTPRAPATHGPVQYWHVNRSPTARRGPRPGELSVEAPWTPWKPQG